MSQSEPTRTGFVGAPIAWMLAAIALAGVLSFVPLFNLLGYELSFAVTPLVALAALQLGLREGRRPDHVTTMWLRATWKTLPTLLAPVVVMTLNALRVRNCNQGIGAEWYVVLPLPSALFGAALGVSVGVLTPQRTSRVRSLTSALAILLAAAAWSLGRLYFAPPIFVFDPLFGYFAGSLYDEHVGIPPALVAARVYHLSLAIAFLSIASKRRVLAIVTSVVALGLYLLGPKLGYREDASSIARSLRGERRTEHFVIAYRPDGPYGKEIDDTARELELDYAELYKKLGYGPSQVHAYLFASAAEKQSFMGAGHTYIAKPWRNEIYINHEPFPQDVMAHELAHVFGARVGDWLLGLARDGLSIDVGLVEGFAEALTWHNDALTADETVRVLELLGRAPDLDAVMSPRFWSLPAQQAYAIAGSFCQFLIDRGGTGELSELYRRGGARSAYRELYGATFEELEAAWREHVDKTPIDEAVLERERDRILRPSIFRRPCARELARRLELARTLSGKGDHAGARKLYEEVCADEPDDPGHLDELLDENIRAGDRAAAEELAKKLIAHPKTSGAQKGAAYNTLGDLRVQAGDLKSAVELFGKAAASPAEAPLARLYSVKAILVQRVLDGGTRDVLDAFTHSPATRSDDYAIITAAAKAHPADGLLVYLGAKQMFQRNLFADTDAALELALKDGLADPRFTLEAERLQAEVAFRRRDFLVAAARYAALQNQGNAAARLGAARWERRSRWFATH